MAQGWRGQYFRYKDLFLNIVSLYKQRRDLRAFLELALSLSTLAIFITFALKPTVLTIVNLYNQIKDKRSTLVSLNQKIADLQAASNVFSQNQNFIQDIDNSIFSSPEPETISKQILGLGAKNNVSILGISVGQIVLVGKSTISKATSDLKPLPGGAFAIPISLSVKGGYSDLLKFVNDFENLRIPIKIDALTINSTQTQGGNVIVAVITARIPYISGL